MPTTYQLAIDSILVGGEPRGRKDFDKVFSSLVTGFPGAKGKPLIWLNPPDLPEEELTKLLAALSMVEPALISIGWGEWRNDARPTRWRAAIASSSLPVEFSVLRGTSLYLENPFAKAATISNASAATLSLELNTQPTHP